MGELQALSIHVELRRSWPGDRGVVLRPSLAFSPHGSLEAHFTQVICPIIDMQTDRDRAGPHSALLRALELLTRATWAHRVTNQLGECKQECMDGPLSMAILSHYITEVVQRA